MIIRKNFPIVLLALFVPFFAAKSIALAQEDIPSNCRAKLSKKGAMIYDGVKQKITPDSNMEELWKEVARDLITANLMGREDASEPAKEALSCLKTNEP